MAHPSQRTLRVEARIAPDALALIKRIIENTEVIRLSVEGRRRFAEAILNPPEPIRALRRAFAKHRELFGDA